MFLFLRCRVVVGQVRGLGASGVVCALIQYVLLWYVGAGLTRGQDERLACLFVLQGFCSAGGGHLQRLLPSIKVLVVPWCRWVVGVAVDV